MISLKSFAGYSGFILMILGVILALFFANPFWYSFFVIGGTLFFGYLNYKINNKSIFNIFEKSKQRFIYIWVSYIILAFIIEIVGRFLLNLWYYPHYSLFEELVNVYLIGYPFALFMLYETFILINYKIKSLGLIITITTLVSAFIHEFPNTFVYEWAYTIPYVTFEILRINIVVIVGWVILVLASFIIQGKFIIDKK